MEGDDDEGVGLTYLIHELMEQDDRQRLEELLALYEK